MSFIDFYHVTKRFDSQSITALDDVSFSMDRGDFYYLIGPSGAGKSTLLRLIYRDIVPTKGQILINDQNIGSMDEGDVPYLRRRVGVVFQDFKLLPDRTVFDNVAISLLVQGVARNEINRRVMKVLEQVGLADQREKNPRRLAGGEQQRVSMARALVKEPEILLADEPTGNLDPKMSNDILNLLDDINDRGTTLIMATHDYQSVKNHDHACLILENGKLMDGPTDNPDRLHQTEEFEVQSEVAP